jgi:hypothetical protein
MPNGHRNGKNTELAHAAGDSRAVSATSGRCGYGLSTER